MDDAQQLFNLMALAEDQQKAAQAALDGLAAERAALAQERAALEQAAASIRRAASDTAQELQEAVGEAVGRSLAGASETAANALSAATGPIVGQLSGAVQAADEAGDKLHRAATAFGWRWVAMAAAAAAGGIVAVVLAAWLTVWWQRHQVNSLAEQKAALAADVAQMRANVATLAKKGGRIVMADCDGRLCIEVNSKDGHWTNTKTGATLVIPKGY